jgi:hypothetical protein
VALIDTAKREIDMAAYVLSDWPIMQALTRAADRGVKVRIYLDGTQLGEREPAKAFRDLAETPTVEVRTKRDYAAPMHLKSYQIDGRLLFTGAMGYLPGFALAILVAAKRARPRRLRRDLIQIRNYFRTPNIFPNLRSGAKTVED